MIKGGCPELLYTSVKEVKEKVNLGKVLSLL